MRVGVDQARVGDAGDVLDGSGRPRAGDDAVRDPHVAGFASAQGARQPVGGHLSEELGELFEVGGARRLGRGPEGAALGGLLLLARGGLGLLPGALGRVARPALLVRSAAGRLLLGAFGLAPAAGARDPGHSGHRAAAGDLLHHLAGLLEAVHERVDLLDGRPRALGDPHAARSVEDLGVVALAGGHRTDDRLDPGDGSLVELLEGLAVLAHAGQHPHDLLHRPHALDLLELLDEVVEREGPFAHLRGELGLLLLAPRALGLFDEREDVAHVQDAGGHAVGVELFEVRQLLAGGGEEDGDARHSPHGQRRAAAGVAVEFGDHHAGEADALLEGVGGGHGVLADHRVDDEEHLVGVDGGADVGGLAHHLLVDAQAPGGVHDDDVVPVLLGPGQPRPGHRDGVADAVAGLWRPHVHPGLGSDDLQLGDGVGALEVGGDQEHLSVALVLQPPSELARQGGLARALQAREHDDRGPAGQVELAGLPAQDLDEFVVDDLDDLLARVERLGGDGAGRLLPHRRGEGPDDGQGDVGVQERAPDLRDGLLDVRGGQAPLGAEVLEGFGDSIGKRVEHEPTSGLRTASAAILFYAMAAWARCTRTSTSPAFHASQASSLQAEASACTSRWRQARSSPSPPTASAMARAVAGSAGSAHAIIRGRSRWWRTRRATSRLTPAG